MLQLYIYYCSHFLVQLFLGRRRSHSHDSSIARKLHRKPSESSVQPMGKVSDLLENKDVSRKRKLHMIY